MVAFSFNFYGYDFEHGIMILMDSLLAATDALKAKRVKTAEDWAAYEAGVKEGSVKEVEERDDETGQLIWNQSQFYEHDLSLIDENMDVLRKTHVIAAYHLWERTIRLWTKIDGNENFAKLAEAGVAAGLTIDPRMEAVSNLNNTLKHNSVKAGPKLLEVWPELFPDGYAVMLKRRLYRATKLAEEGMGAGPAPIDWFAAVTITPAQMDDIFAAIRASGPKANGN